MKAIAVINFTFSFLCLVVGLVSLLTTGTFWLSPWAFTLFATSFGMICLVVRNNSATIQELKELIRGTRGSLGNTEDQQFSLDDQAIEDGLIAPYRETPESEIVEYLDSGS